MSGDVRTWEVIDLGMPSWAEARRSPDGTMVAFWNAEHQMHCDARFEELAPQKEMMLRNLRGAIIQKLYDDFKDGMRRLNLD